MMLRLNSIFQNLTIPLVVLSALPAAASANAPDVRAYDALLRAHVVKGAVDYAGLRAPTARAALRGYVQAIAEAPEPPTRQQRLAAWINAYSALVLEGVLEGESPATLYGRSHFFLWRKSRAYRHSLTLSSLENDILRPQFSEPRVHFAINCASRSCPALRSEAYTAARLESQLDDQGRQFLQDPYMNRFDASTKTLALSSIFKWYATDFAKAGGLIKFLAPFVPVGARPWLGDADVTIHYLDYDWRSNGRR